MNKREERRVENGEGLGERAPSPPHPSPYFSFAVFRAAPQLTERLEQATVGWDASRSQVTSSMSVQLS